MLPQVFHLVISLAPGGLERLVVDWTNARNRHRPGSTRIVCLDEPGALAGQVEGGAVVCLHANRSRPPFDYIAVGRLRQLLSEASSVQPSAADDPGHVRTVLHSHNAAAWQYGSLACAGKGIRHVHTEHGTNPHYRGIVNRLRNAWLRWSTDEMVAVADAVAQTVSTTHGILLSKIRVIQNGISIKPRSDDSRVEMRERWHVPPEARVVGFVGRLAPVKGCDRLIAALATGTPTTFLLLVGDGAERANLERQARGLGVAARVIFAGYQTDPWPWLKAMDWFVLPSRSEGLSISLLEAMGAGVPVAVTDVGENRRVIAEGRNGVLLSGNECEWMALLDQAEKDPGAMHTRTESARENVIQSYSLEVTLAEYERLYADVSGKGRQG
jgi:glycosyltransferase involved in cell wall biosynthesis